MNRGSRAMSGQRDLSAAMRDASMRPRFMNRGSLTMEHRPSGATGPRGFNEAPDS